MSKKKAKIKKKKHKFSFYRTVKNKCIVYDDVMPQSCTRDGFNTTIHSGMARIVGNNRDQFLVGYCERCNIYYVDYNFYLEHWDVVDCINPDEVEKLEELYPEKKPRIFSKVSMKMQRNNAQKPKKKKMKHNRIEAMDFVVRSSIFRCKHKDHCIENIDAVVKIINKQGIIIEKKIAAGYCMKCKAYFIMESTFQEIKKEGVLICRISDEKSYLNGNSANTNMNLAQKSILKQLGYSVSQKDGLTDIQRERILSIIIDNNILSKPKVIGYLNYFIRQHKSKPNNLNAVKKWTRDRAFISNYKVGSFREVRINQITRKKKNGK